ncbi:hypothetical protein DFH06DRAFT_1331034 [Mycena polygramma]|nr:hypothetical protein DFH06DRAFT_1331034 [Mycena polygramma]
MSLSPSTGLADVWPALSLCCPGGFLFPNLRTLRCLRPLRDLIVIRIFLSRSLETVSLVCHASITNISLLSTLADSCPRLKHVSISWDGWKNANESTSLFVCALRHIESLAMNTPTIPALSHLGQLSTLTQFNCETLPDGILLSPPLFPSLRMLTVDSVEIGRATAFLRMCSDTPLVSLELGFRNCPTSAETEAFYAALSKGCSHTFLDSLSLRSVRLPRTIADRKAYIIPGPSLRHLRCFHNIKMVSIIAPVGFDLDDGTVADLVGAWPNVRTLSLQTIQPGDTASRVTLQSLRYLAQSCPHLVSLHLPFDATEIPPPSTVRVVQHSLNSIQIECSCSPISEATPVARYLSGLFPNLNEIKTDLIEDEFKAFFDDGGRAVHRLWKQIEAQVPEFVKAREEERAWGIQ